MISQSDVISKAKSLNISLNGIAMHLISCSKHHKNLMSILIDVMSQVPHCMIKQFARSMSWFLSCHAARDLPLGENYRNSRLRHVQIFYNVERLHAMLTHTNTDRPLLCR